MNGIQGALHFDITGDNTNLEKALAASRASIISSGETADREGARIEQMFKRATSGALAFFSVAKATDVNNRDDMIMNGFIRDIINSKSDLADILNDF